jgi:hypothetical protein
MILDNLLVYEKKIENLMKLSLQTGRRVKETECGRDYDLLLILLSAISLLQFPLNDSLFELRSRDQLVL